MSKPARIVLNDQVLSFSRWVCIYPAFINSKKSLAEGRRIPKQKSVENPTISEMMEAIAPSGLKVRPENKQYCRERSTEFNVRGRLRVSLRDENGELCNPDFPSSKCLIVECKLNMPFSKSIVDCNEIFQEKVSCCI